MVARRKNAAAYHVNLSAVKKTQNEKRGMEIIRQISPIETASLDLCFNISKIKIIKKIKSCIFIIYFISNTLILPKLFTS